MLLKDLFIENDIDCPEWLSDIMIDDYWGDSEYSYVGDVHQWSFNDELRNVRITFDGETYILKTYYLDSFMVLQQITESDSFIV